jgi:hypothetical protein
MILQILLTMLATPDTLLRWYRQLSAEKFDGSTRRATIGATARGGRDRTAGGADGRRESGLGYRRIQGALANLGHRINKITVRHIMRHHHLEPAPRRRKAGMSGPRFLRAPNKTSAWCLMGVWPNNFYPVNYGR